MAVGNDQKQMFQEAVRLAYELKTKIDGYEGDDPSKYLSAEFISFTPGNSASITDGCTDINSAVNALDYYVSDEIGKFKEKTTDITYSGGTTYIGKNASFSQNAATIFGSIIGSSAAVFPVHTTLKELTVSGSSNFNGNVSLPNETTIKSDDGKTYNLWLKLNSNTTNINDESSARAIADANLQKQIDATNATQNVVDIVATKAELDNYKTTNLGISDKIEVLKDESQNGANTIYSWTGSMWKIVGSKAPYYSKTEMDLKLDEKQDEKYNWSDAPTGQDGDLKTVGDLVSTLYTYFDGAMAKSAEKDSEGNVISETYARQADLNTETNRAKNAENSIRSSLNSEVASRMSEITKLQNSIDGINAAHNLVDIVGTKADLDNLNTNRINIDDKVEVMADETSSSATTIYKWNGFEWKFVGVLGQNYTKSEANAMFIRRMGDVIESPSDISDVQYAFESSSGTITINLGYGKSAATATNPGFKIASIYSGYSANVMPGEFYANGTNGATTDYRFDGIEHTDDGSSFNNYSYPKADGTITVVSTEGNEHILTDGENRYFLPKTGSVIPARSEVLASGHTIDLTVDDKDYTVTATLKDKENNIISTATIDLPIETLVVDGEYDNDTKEIVLTLQNNEKIRFKVSELVAGFQTEKYDWSTLPALTTA